jgi:hypothetical protein
MALNGSADRAPVSVANAQVERVSREGSSRHPHLNVLLDSSGPHASRDLADAVHLLCNIHGRHPGVIALALLHGQDGPARDWLSRAAEAFERERLYLVKLTAAVGPMPSTPGSAETEASLLAQRHALETLGASERRGCALGATTALVGDWWSVRRLLDRAASRLGLISPPPSLPDEASIIEVIDLFSDSPAAQRAVGFGSEQMLLQHRALFDLLEARASARGDF